MRPLERPYRHRLIAATLPDHSYSWQKERVVIAAEEWTELVVPDAQPSTPSFTVWAIHDPRYPEPLLVVTSLALPTRLVRDITWTAGP